MGKYATSRPGDYTATPLGSRVGQPHRDVTVALRALTKGTPYIYALRLPDGTIKIGCSANVAVRRGQIDRDAEVIALSPGDFDREAEIHHMLRHYRARGNEYYRPAAKVFTVINRMRHLYQLPPLDR